LKIVVCIKQVPDTTNVRINPETNTLMREDEPYLSAKTRVFMRDCADHLRQACDLVDSYRDIATGLMDLYLSMMSQRMNEVMKVLTIIATIFIPLTFIAGVYGMNFRHMPELEWEIGYPFVLALMLVISIAMLFYFRRKSWL